MKKKIIFILMITLLALIFSLNNCTILSERWNIDWHNTQVLSPGRTLTIINSTDEYINSVRFYVNDRPVADWSSIASSSNWIGMGQSAVFTIGTGSENIQASPGDIIWIKVAADGFSQSQLFAVDGFTSESQDVWQATIYKK